MDAVAARGWRQEVRSFGRRTLERPAIARTVFSVLERTVPAYLRRFLSTTGPVIVGPWSSEIGNELLYWIPFLHRLRDRGLLDPSRTFAVARGDNRDWYQGLCAGYYNFFDDVSVDEYRGFVSAHRRLEKRLFVDALDRRVLALSRKRFGVPSARVLHPMVMNGWFFPVWTGKLSADLTAPHLSFRRFKMDSSVPDSRIPDGRKRVAVKFWFNQNLPNIPANVAFVDRVVRTLAERYTVLLLSPRSQFDGHAQVPVTGGPHVIDCRELIAPHDNLRSQTELMANAEYFVGTFGGLGLLPGFLGKTAFVFHSEPFFTIHLDTAYRMWDELTPDGYRIRQVSGFDLSELP